jgi:hypothetical protein
MQASVKVQLLPFTDQIYKVKNPIYIGDNPICIGDNKKEKEKKNRKDTEGDDDS